MDGRREKERERKEEEKKRGVDDFRTVWRRERWEKERGSKEIEEKGEDLRKVCW